LDSFELVSLEKGLAAAKPFFIVYDFFFKRLIFAIFNPSYIP